MTDNYLDKLLIDAQQKVIEAVEQWVRKQVLATQVYTNDNKVTYSSLVTVNFIELLQEFEIDIEHITKSYIEYDTLSDSMLFSGKHFEAKPILNFKFTKFSQYELQKNIEFANSVFTWIKNHEHPDEILF